MMFSLKLKAMVLRGLRKPMDAIKASMGDLTPFPYLNPSVIGLVGERSDPNLKRCQRCRREGRSTRLPSLRKVLWPFKEFFRLIKIKTRTSMTVTVRNDNGSPLRGRVSSVEGDQVAHGRLDGVHGLP